jgi:RimJ/RimL family protein N-acetyltransferase
MISMQNWQIALKPAPLETPPERLELIASWLNNKSHMRFSEQRHAHHSIESVERYRLSFDQANSLLWDIFIVDGNTFVGTISAMIDEPNKIADMGVLIGPMYTKLGIGFEAWRMVMRHLKTRADCITAGMMQDNIVMRRICDKAGMQPSGFQLNRFLYGGRREAAFFYQWVRNDEKY